MSDTIGSEGDSLSAGIDSVEVPVFDAFMVKQELFNDHFRQATVENSSPDVWQSLFIWVPESVQTFLQVGGPVVWILSLFSLVALTIVLLKMWQFARLRPEALRDVTLSLAHWQRAEPDLAMNALLPQRPVSALVLKAMRGMHEQETVAVGNSVAAKNSRQAAEASLKEELERYALGRLHELRAFLRPLEVIATLSPLLGLLGTVLGMIVAFQQMEAAGRQVDPTVLSGGIWQALLTTAVGLAVAIPVVAVHSWLERKTDRVAHHMNDAVTRVFTQYGVRDTVPAVVAEKDTEVVACAA